MIKCFRSKSERKVFTERTRPQKKNKRRQNQPPCSSPQITNEIKQNSKNDLKREPLAPIIEEIKNREPLKPVNGGSEIDKIAEKLKSLVKSHADEKLDRELLVCKESFDKDETPRKFEERNVLNELEKGIV